MHWRIFHHILLSTLSVLLITNINQLLSYLLYWVVCFFLFSLDLIIYRQIFRNHILMIHDFFVHCVWLGPLHYALRSPDNLVQAMKGLFERSHGKAMYEVDGYLVVIYCSWAFAVHKCLMIGFSWIAMNIQILNERCSIWWKWDKVLDAIINSGHSFAFGRADQFILFNAAYQQSLYFLQ